MVRKVYFLTLMILFFVTSFVSAQLSLSQPLEKYNLGDKLYISADGLRGLDSGNLNIDLRCGNVSVNLLKISARAFSLEEDQSYSIPYKILDSEDLEISNVSDIVGTCQVFASLGSQSTATLPFTISKEIIVSASLVKQEYEPGETIRVTVDAVKSNGNLVNGFVESNNATSFSKAMTEGKIVETFSMPKTIEAGLYSLGLHVYDTGKAGILNEGFSTLYFEIKAVPTSIVLSLSSEEVSPGQEFTVGAEVLDQAGKNIQGNVDVKIISPESKEFVSSIKTGEFSKMNFEANSTPGIWKVVSSFGGIVQEREIKILELQKVSFEFEDAVLIVKNVGNVIYNKTISLKIGNETKELFLNMDLGEVRKFNLQAPSGEYKVLVGDGETTASKSILLTGNVIAVKDMNNRTFFSYAIVWSFLILVLATAGIIFIYRSSKSKEFGKERFSLKSFFGKFNFHKKLPKKMQNEISNTMNFTNKCPVSQSLDDSTYKYDDKTLIDVKNHKRVSQAESTLVLKGDRSFSSVVAVSVKNYDKLGSSAKSFLMGIVDETKDSRGLVDWRSNEVFVIFSPLITKTYGNENLAVRTALALSKKLNDYNKKFRDRIEFNIAVHSGELVASKEKGQFKYTSLGNTISLSKRMAESNSSKVLISESIRKKLMRELKVSKIGDILGNPIYEILEVKDMEANKAKLNDLLKRMDNNV